MLPKRTLIAVYLLACALAIVVLSATNAAAIPQQAAWISQGGSETQMDFDGGCWTEGQSSVCSDPPGGRQHTTIALTSPGIAMLRLMTPADSVVATDTTEGAPGVAPLEVSEVDATDWKITIGHAIPTGHQLSVFVHSGSNEWIYALTVVAPVSATPPSESSSPAQPAGAQIVLASVKRHGRALAFAIKTSQAGRLSAYVRFAGARYSTVSRTAVGSMVTTLVKVRLTGRHWRAASKDGNLILNLANGEKQLTTKKYRLSTAA